MVPCRGLCRVQRADVVVAQHVEDVMDLLSGGGHGTDVRPRRAATRSVTVPNLVWDGRICTDSSAAHRTGRDQIQPILRAVAAASWRLAAPSLATALER